MLEQGLLAGLVSAHPHLSPLCPGTLLRSAGRLPVLGCGKRQTLPEPQGAWLPFHKARSVALSLRRLLPVVKCASRLLAFWWWSCCARNRSPVPMISASSCSPLPAGAVLLSRGSRDREEGCCKVPPACPRLLQSLDPVQPANLHPVLEIPIFLTNGFKGLSVSALLSLFTASVFVWQKASVFQ